MATLILSSNRAEKQAWGGVSIAFDFDASKDPVPRETVEIRTTADALAALDAYAEKAKAAGKPARVSARLPNGVRAPSGFRKARLERFVNLD